MVESEENILRFLPQRFPFIMVDKLLYSDEGSSRTSFRIREENVFAKDGFFSAAGMMENMAQTAAAGAGSAALLADGPIRSGFIISVKNLRIVSLPVVNDELITEIRIEQRVLDIVVISGSILCKGVEIAQCEMKILISQPA